MNGPIPVAASARRGYSDPDFVCRPHAVGRLQQQLKIEAQLHFDNEQTSPLTQMDGDDVAAVYLALDLEAGTLKELLDDWIQVELGHDRTLQDVAASPQEP